MVRAILPRVGDLAVTDYQADELETEEMQTEVTEEETQEIKQPVLTPVIAFTDEDRVSWLGVNIATDDNGRLNMQRTIFLLSRALSRVGHSKPGFAKGPLANSWWGPEEIKFSDLQNQFIKYDIDVTDKQIRRAINELIKRGLLDRTDETRSTFHAHTSML